MTASGEGGGVVVGDPKGHLVGESGQGAVEQLEVADSQLGGVTAVLSCSRRRSVRSNRAAERM
jgi:hypothetical protein